MSNVSHIRDDVRRFRIRHIVCAIYSISHIRDAFAYTAAPLYFVCQKRLTTRDARALIILIGSVACVTTRKGAGG